MTAIVSFIGWQDSTNNLLASGVVAHLKRMGLRVAVIKSSDKRDIRFNTPDTETYVESLKINEELKEIELRIKL